MKRIMSVCLLLIAVPAFAQQPTVQVQIDGATALMIRTIAGWGAQIISDQSVIAEQRQQIEALTKERDALKAAAKAPDK